MIRDILIAFGSSLLSFLIIFYLPLNLAVLLLTFFVFIVFSLKSFYYGYFLALCIFWASFALNSYTKIQIFNQSMDLQFLILLILALFFPFIKYSSELSDICKKNKFIISAFICFILISSIATYFSPTPYSLGKASMRLSIEEILRYTAWLVIYIISLYMFKDSEYRQKFIQYISIFIIFISIAALIEYFTGYNFFMKDSQKYVMGVESSVLTLTRARAVFNHPNILSIFLVLFFPLLMFNLLNEKKFKNKIFPATALALLPLGLLVTLSRTAWITAILAIIALFFIFYKNKTFYFLLFSVAVIVAAIVLVFFNNKSLTSDIDTRMQTDVAISGRIMLWKGLWEKSKNNKLFGYGLSSVETYLSKQVIGRPMLPHNEPLKVLTENGYPGFIAYASIFIAFIFKYLQRWFKNRDPANIVALIVVFSYLLAATTSNTWNFQASFFFVILAFIDNVSNEQQQFASSQNSYLVL